MDPRTRITYEILERAWLYRDPASFREGVMETTRALTALDEDPSPEPWEPEGREAGTCPECSIPYDEPDADDATCPWCGARRPDPLQAVVWAELRAMELAWPEMLSA
jgi:hypothetical protein